MTLKADRKLSTYGGHGIAIALHNMRSNSQVFWSARHNSFVCVRDEDGLKLISVNGIGEIRWTINDWNTDSESNSVRDYFFEKEN